MAGDGLFEGDGIIPNESLTARAIFDKTVTIEKLSQLAHPDQPHATMAIPFDIEVDCTDATTLTFVVFNANAPIPFKIVSVVVQALATVGAGTCQVDDGTNNITDAIVCATDTNIVRVGTIDDDYSSIAAGGTLRVIQNGATNAGWVTLHCIRMIS